MVCSAISIPCGRLRPSAPRRHARQLRAWPGARPGRRALARRASGPSGARPAAGLVAQGFPRGFTNGLCIWAGWGRISSGHARAPGAARVVNPPPTGIFQRRRESRRAPQARRRRARRPQVGKMHSLVRGTALAGPARSARDRRPGASRPGTGRPGLVGTGLAGPGLVDPRIRRRGGAPRATEGGPTFLETTKARPGEAPTRAQSGGGREIRTLEAARLPGGFQDRCIQPLCHPSMGYG